MGKTKTGSAMDLGLSGRQARAIDVGIKRRRKRSLKKSSRSTKDGDGMMISLPTAVKAVSMTTMAMSDDSSISKKGQKMVLKVKPKAPKAELVKIKPKIQALGVDKIKSGRGQDRINTNRDKKKNNSRGSKKTLAQRSTAHVPDRVKDARARDLAAKFAAIHEAIKDGSLARGEKGSLLDYLREQRNHYDGGRLGEEVQEELEDLQELGFSWLDATFKEGRFRKSLGVRFGKPNWTRARLRGDPWVNEMQTVASRGELPGWAQAEMDKLIDAAPVL